MNNIENNFYLKNQEVSKSNKQELTTEEKEMAKIRYKELIKDIESSDNKSTIMNFHYGQVIKDGKTIREAENIAHTLMMKDNDGNIGIIGLAPNIETRYMINEGGNQLVNIDDPKTPIKTIEPNFAAIIEPNGTIHGELPQKLLDFLTYEKHINNQGEEEYTNSNFGKGGAITISYFYTKDKKLTNINEIKKISQQLTQLTPKT